MPDIKPFSFDYFHESILPKGPSKVEDIARRARAVVAKRSEDEIRAALVELRTVLDAGLETFSVHTIKRMSAKGIKRQHMSNVAQLQHYMEAHGPMQSTGFQNATWAEYFAALALLLVFELIAENDFAPAVDAMEAVCFAELIQAATEEGLDADNHARKLIARLRRQQARSGGRAKGKRFDGLKTKVRQLDDTKYSGLSARESARRICVDLADEVKATLTTPDPENTVQIWLGQSRRERKKGAPK